MLEAEEELKGPVADNRLHAVVLAATGSEEAASAALTYRVEQRLRRGEPQDI